jgi:rare lipoprotein A
MRLPDKACVAAVASLLLAGCISGPVQARQAPGPIASGPQEDYPVVVGDPFTVDGVTYIPQDVLNYDAVGQALAGEVQAAGVAGAHRTLPLPSYVEVTHLETGRTILVRLTERGPMQGNALIALSPSAANELGLSGQPSAPVRVRRVNPPEVERAKLRAGEPVPARMDTPPALLTVLKRKLANETVGTPAALTPAPVSTAASPLDPEPVAVPVAPAVPDRQATAAPATKGTFVQLGAFSSEANARKAAASVDGHVTKTGKFWVARMGPFATKAEADGALAKARAAGYGDAMVRRVN